MRGLTGDGGPATSASLTFPGGVAVDSAGNLYIADNWNNRIRKVSGGTITTVAGDGAYPPVFSGDGGPATNASLNYPQGMATDAAGNLYIADTSNYRVRKVSGGVITTVAGDGVYRFSGDGGPAASAQLNYPNGAAVDSAGNLYIADTNNNRIRKVSGGIITTVAGNGSPGFSGDGGPAIRASLNQPSGVAVDSAGNLYIADELNSRVRKVSGGTITTVAGNGGWQFSGDGGPAASASLNYPTGVAVDSTGNLYIADAGNSRVRKVSGGTITTVAGNGSEGFSGDGGPAAGASLYLPMWPPASVAVDLDGNLYVADAYNNRIRRVFSGTITTVAGNGHPGFSGDGGPPASASLNYPTGVAVDSAGNLYIADAGNERIRKVSGGTITTVAGNGSDGFSGDGRLANSASLYWPVGVAVDSTSNLYIADATNNRIREVFAGAFPYQATPLSLSFSAAAGGSAPGAQTVNLSTSVGGLSFTATTSTAWLNVSPSSGSMPAVLAVSVDPTNLAAGTYQGTVTITAPNAVPSTTTVAVTLTVQPGSPPRWAWTRRMSASPQPKAVALWLSNCTSPTRAEARSPSPPTPSQLPAAPGSASHPRMALLLRPRQPRLPLPPRRALLPLEPIPARSPSQAPAVTSTFPSPCQSALPPPLSWSRRAA